MFWFVKSDNGNDHRAGTIDLNIEKQTQVRLRVHRIVIPRIRAFVLPFYEFKPFIFLVIKPKVESASNPFW